MPERQDHIGLFNPENISDPLVGRQPNGKAGCEVYDDEATFILNSEHGQAYNYVNNGKSSTLNNMTPAMELYNDGAWSATAYNLAPTNDYIVTCTPPSNMGWSLSQTGGRYYISFPPTNAGHGGYLFYFCGWNTQYEVRAISETHMKVLMWSTPSTANCRCASCCCEPRRPSRTTIRSNGSGRRINPQNRMPL